MPDQAVILLAEDREDDILLIRKAFQKAFKFCLQTRRQFLHGKTVGL